MCRNARATSCRRKCRHAAGINTISLKWASILHCLHVGKRASVARFIGLSAVGGLRPGIYAGCAGARFAYDVSPVYRAPVAGRSRVNATDSPDRQIQGWLQSRKPLLKRIIQVGRVEVARSAGGARKPASRDRAPPRVPACSTHPTGSAITQTRAKARLIQECWDQTRNAQFAIRAGAPP